MNIAQMLQMKYEIFASLLKYTIIRLSSIIEPVYAENEFATNKNTTKRKLFTLLHIAAPFVYQIREAFRMSA